MWRCRRSVAQRVFALLLLFGLCVSAGGGATVARPGAGARGGALLADALLARRYASDSAAARPACACAAPALSGSWHGEARIAGASLTRPCALGHGGHICALLANVAEGRGWRNHPATRAWEGHADALARYANACIDEWVSRGFRNTMQRLPTSEAAPMPWWFGFAPLHFSHRASLLRKDPAHYAAAFAAAAAAEAGVVDEAAPDGASDALASFVPTEYRTLGYVWPHTVPEELRGTSTASAQQLCAPVQAPPRAKKKSKKARSKTPDEDVEEAAPVTTPTARAMRAARRSR